MSFAAEVFSTRSEFDSHLSIAGVSASDLAQEFGTPLFVIDEADFKDRLSAWRSALEDNFGQHAGTVYYAGKVFLNKEIARWVMQSGLGLDVCTGGEMAVALAVDFPGERIQVHGNNKSEAEITQAIKASAANIVIDSFQEIERVARIASELGKIQKVYLRLTAGIEAHTHAFIATAHEDVKFGFSIASGSAWKAVKSVEAHKSLNLAGFHSHIGSQIFGSEGFALAAERVIALCAKFRDVHARELPELDLGGGYGIAYLPGEESVIPSQIMSELARVVKSECEKHSLRIPQISIEPGRAIAGPTTTTLYTVGTTKNVELDDGMTRRYIAVDGGMSDNIRTALYDAEYYGVLANRVSIKHNVSSRIVGKHCESGDILIRQIDLPEDIEPGDIIAIPATGAYGRSMASNYNHVAKPAVIAVLAGKARLIVRREVDADLLALDL